MQSTDLFVRSGDYPQKELKQKAPMTLGYDFVGVVYSAGKDSGVSVGDRVADMSQYGAFATYIDRPGASLVPVPDGVGDEEGTSLVLSYMTAYSMLYRTKAAAAVRAKQAIFVQGGAGAVGRAVIELAVLAGCEVFTSARKSHHAMLVEMGAKPFDYNEPKWWVAARKAAGGRVAASFDGVCPDGFKSSKYMLAGRGALVAYGVHGILQKVQNEGKSKNVAMLGLASTVLPLIVGCGASFGFFSISTHRRKQPQQFRDDLATLFGMVEDGTLKVDVGEVITLEQVEDAHSRLLKGGVTAKIVVRP